MTTYIAILLQSLQLYMTRPLSDNHLACVKERTTLAVTQAAHQTRPYWSQERHAAAARRAFHTIAKTCPR